MPHFILVVPANEAMFKFLYHPDPSVQKFARMDQPVAWPEDAFTIRRLADGDIKKVGDAPPQELPRSGPRMPAPIARRFRR